MSEYIVKSKERIKELGEVYTPEILVQEILKNIGEDDWKDENKTFLDPTCGNGNILIEVLKEKIKYHSNILCLKTIYGIDISSENVIECRKRLFRKSLELGLKPNEYEKAISIIKNNIVHGDMLKLNLDEIW